MTDPIATIRAFISTLPARAYQTAVTAALAALEAELTALREAAPDFSRIPEEWSWRVLVMEPDDGAFSVTLQKGNHNFVDGIGPTPRAALDAAIARANEHGEAK